MTRREIFREIERRLGKVPAFFKTIPDRFLEYEWSLFKILHLDTSSIPDKYKALTGVAIAAVTQCRYSSHFHTEVARLSGATDAEIEEAVHFAKSCSGWSAYLNGMQIDYEQFRNELLASVEYSKKMQSAD